MESNEERLVDSTALPRPGARDWYKLHGTTEKRAFGADPADPRRTLAPSRRLVMARALAECSQVACECPELAAAARRYGMGAHPLPQAVAAAEPGGGAAGGARHWPRVGGLFALHRSPFEPTVGTLEVAAAGARPPLCTLHHRSYSLYYIH
jgi:hypothetical protein